MKQITLLTTLALAITSTAATGAVLFTGSYAQDFQTLPTTSGTWTNNSTLAGWYAPASTINYRATTGATSLTNSDLQSVNLGAGDLALANVNSTAWLILVNDTATTFSSVDVAYEVTKLRQRTGTDNRSLTLNYSVFNSGDGSSVATTNLAPGSAVNLTTLAPEGATTTVNTTIDSISWAPGQELWLKWNFPNQANQHHVAGIDNLTVAIPEPSTYAALLGLCVLGFVAYRRRR